MVVVIDRLSGVKLGEMKKEGSFDCWLVVIEVNMEESILIVGIIVEGDEE